MRLNGELVIGGERARSSLTFLAKEAHTGQSLEPPFYVADQHLVARACELAWSAFAQYRDLALERRARFLEAIADQIMALGEALLLRAAAESGLPPARLAGERTRTSNQLRLFAQEVRYRGWLGVRVDPPLPERQPLPRPGLRQYRVPLGPVAVFGASNFPLAFSVAGGDSAAALAAGCPIVVKGHPAHPGTSELVAQAIIAAAIACEIPAGVFSLLNGDSHELGAALVRHPRIKAVAFTGSRTGGMALVKNASERREPIPVYAEMSSVNPVVLLPGALAAGATELAREFVGSLTLGTGQFCTNPGLVIALHHPDLEVFMTAAVTELERVAPGVMVSAGVQAAYDSRIAELRGSEQLDALGRNTVSMDSGRARPALFRMDAATLLRHPEFAAEVFGPAAVIVCCVDESELLRVLEHLESQLTATLHMHARDATLAQAVLQVLEGKVGRLIANSWPTGVEVAHAMVHGGPYPATSDGRSSSVGTLAIDRFLRPVCYQGFPEALLPPSLREEVLTQYPHRYDGHYRMGTSRELDRP